MDVKKQKRAWIIGVAVFVMIVVACVILWNRFWIQQDKTAEDAALRVERALKQIDTDEKAKEIRDKLVEEIGEFDEVVEVHSYTHFSPGYAYIGGTVSKDGTRYRIQYFLKDDKLQFWGAGEEIRSEENPIVEEEGTTEY